MFRKTPVFLLLCICLSSYGGYHPDDEQKIKFLFIKNFIKNIEWPAGYLNKEFKIGIIGDQSIYNRITMANIRPDHVNGLSVAYYYFASEEVLKNCHLIYIPKQESHLISSIKEYFGNKPVLIVTESDGMCERGAMINFTKDNQDKLTFEYNSEALKNAGLEYSAKFMEQGQDIFSVP